MKSIFFLNFILLFSLSCRKADIIVPFDEIQGEYEWYYSYNDIDDSYGFDAIEDQYGIRITKKGCVQLYKNGKIEENYRILATDKSELTSKVSIKTDDKDEPIYFSVMGDTLSTWVYPYNEYQNYYIKKP